MSYIGITVAVLLLGAACLHLGKRMRKEQASRLPFWAIPYFLGFLALAAGLYRILWEHDTMIPPVFTVIGGSVYGLFLQRARKRNDVVGAVIGGAVGANTAFALHLWCGYTMEESFEDEGLGFFGSLFMFFPYTTVFGAAAGGLGAWVIRVIFKNVGRDQTDVRCSGKTEGEPRPGPDR